MHWIFIFIAAVFEVGWTFSLKFLKFTDLKIINWQNIFQNDIALKIVLPFLGYIICGIGNIYFFSLALKKVQTSTAFAIWTALTIILMKFAEMVFFKGKVTLIEMFFIFIITLGIIGLKVYGTETQ